MTQTLVPLTEHPYAPILDAFLHQLAVSPETTRTDPVAFRAALEGLVEECVGVVLSSLLTVPDLAGTFNVSRPRAVVLAQSAHRKHGVGVQVGRQRTWLFRPEELALVKPEQRNYTEKVKELGRNRKKKVQ